MGLNSKYKGAEIESLLDEVKAGVNVYYTSFTVEDIWRVHNEETYDRIVLDAGLIQAINDKKVIVVPSRSGTPRQLIMLYDINTDYNTCQFRFVGAKGYFYMDSFDIVDFKVGYIIDFLSNAGWYDYANPEVAPIANTLVLRDDAGDIEIGGLKELSTNTTWVLPTYKGSGYDYRLQEQLVSGQNVKTIGGRSVVGSGNIPFKTIGGQSVVGSGNIPVSNDVYIADFTVADIWNLIETVRNNPEQSASFSIDGQGLYEAYIQRKVILIPYGVKEGYATAINTMSSLEDEGYLGLTLFDNDSHSLVRVFFNYNDVVQGYNITLTAADIIVQELSEGATPDSIAIRNGDGGAGFKYIFDDEGNLWATESSSDEAKELVDFIIPAKKRFAPLEVMEDGADVDLDPIIPNCIYYHNTPYDIGSITISDFETRDAVDEYTIYFRSGREGTMLSISDTVCWANGVTPDIEPSTEYELSIVRYNNGGSYITKAVLSKFATV